MKKSLVILSQFCCYLVAYTQSTTLYMPNNIQKAYVNQTRSVDGSPGKKYWQNTAKYNINISLSPPSKTIRGTETITYFNHNPKAITRLVIKLIMNIHTPGAARMGPASAAYLTSGIHIDKFLEGGKEKIFEEAPGNTWQAVLLTKPLQTKDSVQLTFHWHYDVSEESGREGKLDSTSFFLAYFYPRVAVVDDVHGWDRMTFTDAQEFYNDFNSYQVSLTVPKNFLVWGTGNLLNAAEVLQPAYSEKLNKSFTSNEVVNIVTKNDIEAQKITTQNATNTWQFQAKNVSDVAFCISDHYVWDAASVEVDKKTKRRASCQAAYIDTAINFHHQVKYIQHALDWFSNNWPGIPYPFQKSTVVQGIADMEYPMMANDSPQADSAEQNFVTQHEVGHSYFPFYMGINEHRYGFMDEGWTTAFENLIAVADKGKEAANTFFKQFRVAGWALQPNDETQIPVITPTNILSGQALGHNEYGKPALAYLALKDMLGDSLFKKSLQGFMQRWNGKHPIPWDMFNSFSFFSGKNLNWFFNNWFFSNYYIDVLLDKIESNKTGAVCTIKNIGGFAIPIDVMITYADNTTATMHYSASIWQKNTTMATVQINTNKKITSVKLDTGIFMDANEKDNMLVVSSTP
jgi:hypothetical protein